MTTTLGLWASFMASCTWAVGVTHYSNLSRRYKASVVNTSRASLSFFVFTAIAMISGASYRTISSNDLSWFVLSILSSYALGDLFFLQATHDIGLTTSLTIASIYPLWSTLIGVFYEGNTLSLSQYMGVFFCIIGTILVIRAQPRPLQTAEEALKDEIPGKRIQRRGFFFAMLTSLFWALNSVAAKNASLHLDIFVAGSVRMALAVLGCLFVTLMTSRKQKKKPFIQTFFISKRDYVRSTPVFFIEAFGGGLVYVYGLTHTELTMGALLSSLAPVLTVPIEWYQGVRSRLWERLLGILIVMGGLALLMKPL